MHIRVKRIYEPPAKGDGFRILVDRLWPRGIKKDAARLDAWLKEIAPSDGLRKRFHHDPARWDQFKQQYFLELDGKAELVKELREKAGRGTLTLLFAARDTLHNNAEALKEYLER